LNFAVVLDRIGFEAQALQAGCALDGADAAGIKLGEIRTSVAEVLNGGKQRRAPLQPLPLVGLMDQRIADIAQKNAALTTNSASVATRRGVHSRRPGAGRSGNAILIRTPVQLTPTPTRQT